MSEHTIKSFNEELDRLKALGATGTPHRGATGLRV